MTTTNPQSPQNRYDEEIDLKVIGKAIWVKRIQVISITLIFMLLGIIIGFVTPKEFTAPTTFIPQTSQFNNSGGSLGGLASLAGINIGSVGGGAEISPSLYPKFVSSVTFKKALLNAPINVEGISDTISYAKYYEDMVKPGILFTIKKYTIGLPEVFKSDISSTKAIHIPANEGELVKLTQNEAIHFGRLEKQLSVIPNEKEGYVSLSFSMPEPLMAAQMAIYSQKLLQDAVISYKIKNAKEQLRFAEERFAEKKLEFEQAQAKLSYFRDRNQNIASATAQNQLQRLEAEYNFAFNIYSELAKQLEQAKLQVSKDTPIFSVIQPVTIPNEKSAPNRFLMFIGFTFFGFFISICIIFGRNYFKCVKN